jgi:hypothetical protein
MKAITSNKWVLLLILTLVATNLVLAFIAFSQKQSSEVDNSFRKQLGLTEEQAKTFDEKKKHYFATMKPSWEKVAELKDSLYQHLGDADVSDSLIASYVDRWHAINHESDIKLFLHFREMRTHCTPDQQPRFDSVVTKMVSRRRR